MLRFHDVSWCIGFTQMSIIPLHWPIDLLLRTDKGFLRAWLNAIQPFVWDKLRWSFSLITEEQHNLFQAGKKRSPISPLSLCFHNISQRVEDPSVFKVGL